MEISNKNIVQNLNENEEIFYVGEKSKSEFFYFASLIAIFVLPLLTYLMFLFIMSPIKELWIVAPLWLIVISLSYIGIRDYCFTQLILTNQRLIISRFNKLIFIDNNQIKHIYGNSKRFGAHTTFIRLKSNKVHRIGFMDKYKVKDKVKEICPDYDDKD